VAKRLLKKRTDTDTSPPATDTTEDPKGTPKKENPAEQTLGFMAKRYMDLKKQIKLLNDGVSSLKKAITERVQAEGVKDEKGSFHASVDGLQVDYTARVSIRYVDEAEDILMALGVWEKATSQVIDDAKIEALHELGEISDADLGRLLTKETSYALYVKDPSKGKK